MGAVVMNQWSGLEYSNFVAVCSGNFPSVRTTINATDLNIIVTNSWNDLDSFKSN